MTFTPKAWHDGPPYDELAHVGGLEMLDSETRLSGYSDAVRSTLLPRAPIALGVFTSSSPTASEIDAFNALISPRQVDMAHVTGSYEDTAWAAPLAMLASKNITPVLTLESATRPAHAILDGSWDTQLAAVATSIKNFGRPVILRLWHEFNLGGTQNAYGHGTKGGSSGDTTDQLIAAWQYLHGFLHNPGLTGGACRNAFLFWCVNAWGSPADVVDPRPYWPGNAFVDFIGADAYTSVNSSLAEQTFESVVDDNFGHPNYTLLTQMAPGKPYLIGEMGVAAQAPNGAGTIDKRQYDRDAAEKMRAMPALAGILYWNQSTGSNDYTIDNGGTNAGARNGFRDMVNGPPFTTLARNQTARKQVTAVPYASTLTVDCGQGDTFTTTLTGAVIIGAPSGTPFNGQRLVYLLKQDPTGSRVVSSWNSVYRFPTDLPSPTLTTTASKTDRVGFEYNAADSKWDCVQIVKGY